MSSRYYSENNRETGVSAEELAALAPDEQRDYMLDWFERNFEDPVHETPYNGQEGGYQFINGGPYDAATELQREFAGIVSDELIAEVADDVEGIDGVTEWAPGSEHPDARLAQPDDPSNASYLLTENGGYLLREDGGRILLEDAPPPPMPPGQDYLTDEDGTYLTDEDGTYLTEQTPGAAAEPPVFTTQPSISVSEEPPAAAVDPPIFVTQPSITVSEEQLPPQPDLAQLRPPAIGHTLAPRIDPAAEAARQSLLGRVADLERALGELRPRYGRLGHNNPPPEYQLDAEIVPVVDAVAEAAETMAIGLTANPPDAIAVAHTASFLQQFGHWCAGRGTKFADAFAEGLGKRLADAAILKLVGGPILALVTAVVSGAIIWLHALGWV